MKPLTKIQDIFDRGLGLLAYVASSLLLVSWFIVCLEVFMRYSLNRPLTWVVEATEYILLYVTLLGAAWLLKEDGHIKLDLVLNRMNPRTQAVLNFTTSLLGAVTCLVIAWYGTQSTIMHYQESLRTFTALELLKWPFLIVIPFGIFLLFIQFARRAYGCWGKMHSTTRQTTGEVK
ncbi:TRAP transporter small permease subunit [Chloroflexota bacterium]